MKLLIVFNHNYSKIVSPVVAYNRQFSSEIKVAAPFKGEGILNYCSGSYMWQGALVEYLKSTAGKQDHGPTLVLHDDVAINPHMTLDHRFDPSQISFGAIYGVQGEFWSWHWNFRLATNWFSPKSVLFGHGVDSCVETLKATRLYKRNKAHIDNLPVSRLLLDRSADSGYPAVVKGYLETYHGDSTTLDFGLPLYCGNSDFMVLPPGYDDDIIDFLEASIQCGLFVEVAIPTMLMWLNVPIRNLGKELHFPFGEAYSSFDGFRSPADIEEYFRTQSQLLAIHPVKFSRFPNPAA
jgi:hypothetical protein